MNWGRPREGSDPPIGWRDREVREDTGGSLMSDGQALRADIIGSPANAMRTLAVASAAEEALVSGQTVEVTVS
jgi:hypothetical protein